MRTILTTFAVLLAVTALIYADSSRWGRRVVGDRLLKTSTVVNDSLSVPFKTAVFRYSPSRVRARAPNVTYIEARDNVRNGLGGYAELISGGIDQTYATVRLWSPPGHGLDFTVEVYGR